MLMQAAFALLQVLGRAGHANVLRAREKPRASSMAIQPILHGVFELSWLGSEYRFQNTPIQFHQRKYLLCPNFTTENTLL